MKSRSLLRDLDKRIICQRLQRLVLDILRYFQMDQVKWDKVTSQGK